MDFTALFEDDGLMSAVSTLGKRVEPSSGFGQGFTVAERAQKARERMSAQGFEPNEYSWDTKTAALNFKLTELLKTKGIYYDIWPTYKRITSDGRLEVLPRRLHRTKGKQREDEKESERQKTERLAKIAKYTDEGDLETAAILARQKEKRVSSRRLALDSTWTRTCVRQTISRPCTCLCLPRSTSTMAGSSTISLPSLG